ncbi:CrcB family protein [Microbacterium sp. SORGH_AS_0888]|uniref:fluoride efflux transporter FluC n=1 Tax=Microbacterium sp. SORGH_AS_0888 TaxID=3041791 RepID=UPI002784085A|nr:CrcB family protein [Microbacterium sp. SORGH_AS_0888]MDQ1130142.1 CrcB protein [Microbacterium sp. SORGH_AS_0888]
MPSGPVFSWSHLALTALGGAVGVAGRAALLAIDVPAWQAIAVPVINVAGAFLLGVVTGALLRRGESPASRAARHFFGTGVIGGFTTYSTFAVQAVHGAAVWLTVATAVAGVLAAWLGLLLARGRLRPAAPRRGREP